MKLRLLLILFGFIGLKAPAQNEQHFRDSLLQEGKQYGEGRFNNYLAQENKDFKNKKISPLTPRDRRKFKQLRYYPYDSNYNVLAQLVKYDEPKPIEIVTTKPREVHYVRYGELHFKIDTTDCILYVYQNLDLAKKEGYEDYLFLPFKDLTNGDSTYGGGRYVDVRIPKNPYGYLMLDFNKCYNPYCTYNYNYSCPIVPAENHLQVKIKAGVLNYESNNH